MAAMKTVVISIRLDEADHAALEVIAAHYARKGPEYAGCKPTNLAWGVLVEWIRERHAELRKEVEEAQKAGA